MDFLLRRLPVTHATDESRFLCPRKHVRVAVSAAQALQAVVTRFTREAREVDYVRNALLMGDAGTARPPLPQGVVDKILDAADHWCCVEKECNQLFSGRDLNFKFFKFGPIPGKPKRLDFRAKSHDQGWSIFLKDKGTKNDSWTWGEVEVKDLNGKSKLGGRRCLFTNIHAHNRWQWHEMSFKENEGIMQYLEEGDTLEFYFRSKHSEWCIYVGYASMALYYEPRFDALPDADDS